MSASSIFLSMRKNANRFNIKDGYVFQDEAPFSMQKSANKIYNFSNLSGLNVYFRECSVVNIECWLVIINWCGVAVIVYASYQSYQHSVNLWVISSCVTIILIRVNNTDLRVTPNYIMIIRMYKYAAVINIVLTTWLNSKYDVLRSQGHFLRWHIFVHKILSGVLPCCMLCTLMSCFLIHGECLHKSNIHENLKPWSHMQCK